MGFCISEFVYIGTCLWYIYKCNWKRHRKIASRDFRIETVVAFHRRRNGELSSSHSMPFLIAKSKTGGNKNANHFQKRIKHWGFRFSVLSKNYGTNFEIARARKNAKWDCGVSLSLNKYITNCNPSVCLSWYKWEQFWHLGVCLFIYKY